VDGRLGRGVLGEEPHDVRRQQGDTGLAARRDHVLGLRGRTGQRLLADHRAPGPRRAHGDLVMHVGGRTDVDDVDQVEQLVERVARAQAVLAGQPGRRATRRGHDRGELDAGTTGPARRMHRCPETGADEADPDPAHLNAPDVSPLMNCREKMMNKASSGSAANARTASTAFQSVTSCPRNSCVPSVTVRTFSAGVRINGNQRSFQIGSMVYTPMAASPGFTSGTAIRYTRYSLEPSIRAASFSSPGTCWKN